MGRDGGERLDEAVSGRNSVRVSPSRQARELWLCPQAERSCPW